MRSELYEIARASLPEQKKIVLRTIEELEDWAEVYGLTFDQAYYAKNKFWNKYPEIIQTVRNNGHKHYATRLTKLYEGRE